jgi:hypothetical protein
MIIHPFNGIMARVTEASKAVYIEPIDDRYRLVYCVPVEGGITDVSHFTGDLNKIENLLKALEFIAKGLE